MKRAIIYDLDGTLTDTLADLKNSTNHALRTCGYPERTMDEVRSFVGNGIGRLIELAVPKGGDTARCLAEFKAHYMVHCRDNTRLYDGVAEMMAEVKRMGMLAAIVSNKVQGGVDELCQQFFHGLVDVAIGEREGIPRKPSPDMVHMAIRQLGVEAEECIYLGDSEVDVATARNAGLSFIGALWGFRTRQQLVDAGATTLAATPADVVDLLR